MSLQNLSLFRNPHPLRCPPQPKSCLPPVTETPTHLQSGGAWMKIAICTRGNTRDTCITIIMQNTLVQHAYVCQYITFWYNFLLRTHDIPCMHLQQIAHTSLLLLYFFCMTLACLLCFMHYACHGVQFECSIYVYLCQHLKLLLRIPPSQKAVMFNIVIHLHTSHGWGATKTLVNRKVRFSQMSCADIRT